MERADILQFEMIHKNNRKREGRKKSWGKGSKEKHMGNIIVESIVVENKLADSYYNKGTAADNNFGVPASNMDYTRDTGERLF